MRVREYVAQDGSVPFKKWFDGLNSLAAAKVSTALVRIELGNTSNIKWFSGLGEYVTTVEITLRVTSKDLEGSEAS